MKPTLLPKAPLPKAVVIALLCLLASAALFAFLVYADINFPDNWRLAKTEDTKLEVWLPSSHPLFKDMVLVSRSITKNEDIAKNDPNRKEALQRLNELGRQEGYSHMYLSKDRCIQQGVRTVYMQVVLLKDAESAQRYAAYVQKNDLSEVDTLEKVEIGEQGYQYWTTEQSNCSSVEQEQRLRISFQRNNAMGFVDVIAVKGKNQPEGLQQAALQLAQVIDKNIQAQPIQP